MKYSIVIWRIERDNLAVQRVGKNLAIGIGNAAIDDVTAGYRWR